MTPGTKKTALEFLLDKLEFAAENHDERQYCECGCKNSKLWDHGAVGKDRFYRTVSSLSSDDIKMLVKAARGKR